MYPNANGRRYVGIALAAMFVLIGVAALVWAMTSHPAATFPYVWPFGFFWFVLLWLFLGFFARPWGWRHGWRYGYGQYGPYGSARWARDPAMDAIRERYARGEITKEQFDQMKRDLGPHP